MQAAGCHGMASSVRPFPPSSLKSIHPTNHAFHRLYRATPLNFSTWAIVGLIFNHWIKKRWWGWWRNYNYVTSAALDSGLIFSTVIIFLAITLPEVPLPDWWGNTIPLKTLVRSPFVLHLTCLLSSFACLFFHALGLLTPNVI